MQLLRYHMVVITRDNPLKRAVKRVTTATGSSADFVGDPTGINPQKKTDLVIFDARDARPDSKFLSKVPKESRILYLIGAESLVDSISELKDERVVSLLCHDERFDDDEFIATATKALRGDTFGISKYFPWGVTTFAMAVRNYDQKKRAIDVLMQYAQLAGVRGPVRDRIQLVADELMMNALYHAPTDDDGKELYAGRTLKELAQLDEVNAIEVQYGCSGRYFAISVRDGGGSLSRARALEYLIRAKTGSKIEDKATGAGLGLISVLRSVSKLIFNLDPTSSTEVIGIFDMDLFARGKVGARSLHLFTEEPDEDDEEDEDEDDFEPIAAGGGSRGMWALAALLGAVLSAMVTVYVMRQTKPAVAESQQASPPALIVNPTPQDAVIKLGDRTVTAGSPVDVAASAGVPVVVRVEKDGFEPYERTLSESDLSARLVLEPALKPSAPPANPRRRQR